MSYHSESFETRGQRGGRLQDDSRAYRDEVEEEPTDLDTPASDGLDDDELEDVKIVAEEVDDEGSEDEEGEEAASPLAEDAPVADAEEEEEDEEGAEASETAEQEEEEAGTGAGVRHGGRRDVTVMSHGERRREFPAHKVTAKPVKTARRVRRKKVARA